MLYDGSYTFSFSLQNRSVHMRVPMDQQKNFSNLILS